MAGLPASRRPQQVADEAMSKAVVAAAPGRWRGETSGVGAAPSSASHWSAGPQHSVLRLGRVAEVP